MTRLAGRLIPICLCALLWMAPDPAHSGRPGPAWRPGFPMRAGGSVVLMWTPVPGASGYRLLRRSGKGEFREIHKGAMIAFTDPAAPPNVPHAYKVAAYFGEETGDFSPTAEIAALEPIRPPQMTGAIPSDRAITLRWTNPDGAAYSNVYRGPTENGPFVVVESVRSETFIDRNVDAGKTYYYRVTAFDAAGKESVKSTPVRASLIPESGPASNRTILRKAVFREIFRGEERYLLQQPGEIGITPDGSVFVLERRGIQFFDTDGNYLRRLRFPKEWESAGWAGFDRDGSILLAFHSEEILRKVSVEGKPLEEVRYPAAEPGKRNNPNGVAIDGTGHYWILDGGRAQLIKTDFLGKDLAILGRLPGTYREEERKESDLPSARKVYRNPYDGRLYVILGISSEIKAIDPVTGAVLRTFGGLGPSLSQFQAVGALAFRRNGNLLVLDSLAQVVKEFDKEYRYVATHADIVEKDRVRLSSNLPTSIAFREDLRRLYVVSSLLNQVYIFDLAE